MEVADREKAFCEKLNTSNKEEILYRVALLMHNVTIEVRVYYSEQLSTDLKGRLDCYNEIQHKASAFLMNVLGPGDWANKDFVETIFEIATEGGVVDSLLRAVKFTLSATR